MTTRMKPREIILPDKLVANRFIRVYLWRRTIPYFSFNLRVQVQGHRSIRLDVHLWRLELVFSPIPKWSWRHFGPEDQ